MLLLFAAACTLPGPDEEPDDEVSALPKTDTFPSFYGSVPRNLLMVSMDTFRRDLLTRYGGEGHAPFLDRLVAEGVPLDTHRTCSNWTFPSVMCVAHGATNIEVGFVPDLRDPDNAIMPETMPTMAGRLTNAGFRTMLVTSNSWFSADHNSDYGFETADRPGDRRTTAVFEQARVRLAETQLDPHKPWYLHLHIKEPHPAYDPPDAYLGELEGLPELPYDLTDFDSHYSAGSQWPAMTEEEREQLLQQLLIRYHGEVRWMDDQLAEQFEALDRAGFLDDTLVVFWTDHGEQFWEHGEQTHAYDLHGEENDAVAFLWAKNIVADSWSGPTSHIDLAPTALQLLGVDDTVGMTGVPVGEADADRPIHTLVLGRLGAVQGVVQDDWKMLYYWATGERTLFDLAADPGELDDRYTLPHPRAAALDALLAPQVEALQPLAPRHTPR